MIVPGSLNPLLLAMFGDPLDELGKIERSLRFRSSASGYLSRTVGAVGTTNFVHTKRVLFKLGKVDSGAYALVAGYINANNYAYISITNGAVTVAFFAAGVSYVLTSTAMLRDPASFYDLCVGYDTSQAVASDRVTVELNGKPLAMAGNYPPQNTASAFDYTGSANFVGASTFNGTPQSFYDGQQTFSCSVVGQKLPASTFGQFHPRTGQWRPKSKAAVKSVVDAGGANSFFLPFDDTTNLTTLCADASSKGNNWAANNISLTAGATYDSFVDTPTNNYAVGNIVRPASELSGGAWYYQNLELGTAFAGSSSVGVSTLPLRGKIYWEVEALSNGGFGQAGLGVAKFDTTGYVGKFAGNGGDYASYGVYGMAVDVDAGKAWIRSPALAWLGGGDPVTGTLPTFTFTSGSDWFVLMLAARTTGNNNQGFSIYNFGQQGRSGSAYYASAVGYFQQVPPTGFKALCTKNLPRPLLPRSDPAFVAKTDTGANIVATLAAAAPWADFIKIYKRRDSAEGWRWQFSDDSANCLDSSSTAAKAVFPALAGTSYVGYALKVAAANGVASGRIVHVNGVADVVADGLAKSRKLIILRNEEVGNWYVYHPDLTAGKLLYLEQSVAETTDATISAVTTSGFTVAAALASGTYRWVSIAEIDGFSRLGKHIGNASNDGPVDATGMSPAFSLFKSAGNVGSYWAAVDSARSPTNPATADLFMNLPNAETSSVPAADLVSNGVKLRSGASADNANYSGANIIYLSLSAFPFRYANAR